MPDYAVLQQHARHLLETKYTDQLIAAHAEEIGYRAARAKLPRNLADKILELLEREPELSWDQALRRIIRGRADE